MDSEDRGPAVLTMDWDVLNADDGFAAFEDFELRCDRDDEPEPVGDRAATIHGFGKRISGMTFSPGGDVSKGLYDKPLQAWLSGKRHMEPIWAASGWQSGVPVTRHEARLHRSAVGAIYGTLTRRDVTSQRSSLGCARSTCAWESMGSHVRSESHCGDRDDASMTTIERWGGTAATAGCGDVSAAACLSCGRGHTIPCFQAGSSGRLTSRRMLPRVLRAARGSKVGVTPCLRRGVEGAQTLENSDPERETGLEPATPCLEGRYVLFHRSAAAKPDKFGTSRATQLYGGNGAVATDAGPPAACILPDKDQASHQF